MKHKGFITGMVVGVFVSALFFGAFEIQASGGGKKAEGGHGAAKEDKKADAHAKDDKNEADAKEDTAKEDNAKGGHGKKEDGKDEKSAAGGHGAGKKEEVVNEETKIDRKKFTYYSSVQFLEDLNDEEESEGEEGGQKEEPVKTVYVMPDKCREYSMYLETKRKSLDRMERKLRSQKRMIEGLKKDIESGAEKFTSTEERIKKLTAAKPTDLNDSNPELSKMIKLYETISAEDVAVLLKNLDVDLTVAILKGMQPKKVSKILTAMDPKISAALSSQMVRGF